MFRTAEYMKITKTKDLKVSIWNIKRMYKLRVFNVTEMYMDGEFEYIRGILADIGIKLNVYFREDHIPWAKRNIRTIKDIVRCVLNMLPFKKVLSRMLINVVYSSVFWLNAFPCKNVVSNQLSPRLIVTDNNIDYNKHYNLKYGQYV